MDKDTQAKLVLRFMQEHGAITSLEAFMNFGITRLAAVIHMMRKSGLDVVTEMITTKNRYGQTCHVARYKFA